MPSKDPLDSQIITSQEAAAQIRAQESLKKNTKGFNALAEQAFKGGIKIPAAEILPQQDGSFSFKEKAVDAGRVVLDLLQRGNFAAAGFTEELFVNDAGILEALGRASSEVFSGIGSLQGQKETFRDVLDGLGLVDDTQLRAVLPGVDEVPLIGGIVGGFNLRGSAGLALDIALDPLTYLTGGGAALAKVPTSFKAVQAAKAGTRLIDVASDATKAFTRRGKILRAEERARALAPGAIKELDPVIKKGLLDEADRLALTDFQDELMSRLTTEGIKPKRAAELANTLTPGVLNTSESAIKEVVGLLDGLNPSTAKKLKRALSLDDGARRSEIGASLAQNVRDRSSIIAEAGFKDGARLEALAGDLALQKATVSVIEQAKHTPGLMRDIAPLRLSLPFADDVGFNIGPSGKSFTNWIVQSNLSQQTLRAMNAVLPEAAVKAGVAGAARTKDAFNFIGRTFSQGWSARKLAGYNMFEDAHRNAIAAALGKNAAEIGETKVASWYSQTLKRTIGKAKDRKEAFRKFAIAADTGNHAGLDDVTREAVEEFGALMQRSGVEDVRRGLMPAGQLRANYFPHFIDESSELIEQLVDASARPGRRAGSQATIGRHAEARSFDSIEDIERAAAVLGKEVRINFDPMQALQRRTETSIEGALASDFYASVGREFGRTPIITDPNNYWDLTRQLSSPVSKGGLIAERWAQSSFKPTSKQLSRLRELHGTGAVGDFLRLRMKDLRGQSAINNFVRKYEGFMEALPKIRKMDELAADGTPFVPMPSSFKELSGVWVPASVKRSLQDMSEKIVNTQDMNTLLRAFDNFQNGLKLHLTAMFPSFHFRNAYSNVAQSFLKIGVAALNPLLHTRAAALAAMTIDDTGKVLSKLPSRFKPSDLARTAYRDVTGTPISMRELRNELIRHDVVKDSKSIFEAVGKIGDVPVEGMSFTRKLLNFWSRAGRSAGGFIENEGRIALFTQLRKDGLSGVEAAREVNRALFDYQSLTQFERQYMKRAIPFYVWTKKNIALQASAIRNQPGRVINMTKPFNNEDPDVRNVLAEWQLGEFRMQLDRDGNSIRMLQGIDLPIHSADRLIPVGKLATGQFGAALSQVAAQMTPLLRVPIELMANEQLFSGRSLDRQTSTTVGLLLDPSRGSKIPESLRKWLGYKKTTFPGAKVQYTFEGQKFYLLFRSWILSRYLSSSDKWFNDMTRDDKPMALAFLSTATGLKENEWDLTDLQARKMKQRKDKVEDALIKSGLRMRLGKSFDTSKPVNKAGIKTSF